MATEENQGETPDERPAAADRSVPLTAVLLPPSEAAPIVIDCWTRGHAVAVLDPNAPAAETEARLAVVRPTEVIDRTGTHARPDGQPVAADVAAVVVTSGTTANAKAVELTRRGMEAAAHAVHAEIGREEHDRWLVCVPLHHVAGLSILARSFVGNVPVDVMNGFDPAEIAERAGTSTLTALVPAMLTRLLDEFAPLDRFRVILLGGGPIPAELLQRAHGAGVHVRATYGMTETWGGVVYDGRPLPGVAIDLDEDSEILLDAPMLMRGYRDDDRATNAAFTPDGWFRTGDVGAFLGDGRVQIVDRKKDLVITGGVNVSPTQVEAALVGHSKIADVCVAGAPDTIWGERVVAYVVPAHPANPPTLEELREYGRSRLSAAALPRDVVLVASIPRTESGKPMRRLLVGVQ